MDAEKKVQLERYGVAVLLMIFAFTLWSSFRGMGGRSTRKPAAQAPGTSTSRSEPLTEALHERWNAMEQQAEQAASPTPVTPPATGIGYAAHELRDPLKSLLPAPPAPPAPKKEPVITKPPQPAAEPPTLLVQGLVWGGPNPQAIINGYVYGVGETVEGATIMSISRDGVVVEFAGTKMHLTVVKEPAPDALPRAAQWRGRERMTYPLPTNPTN